MPAIASANPEAQKHEVNNILNKIERLENVKIKQDKLIVEMKKTICFLKERLYQTGEI
jgi:hypothetical protein